MEFMRTELYQTTAQANAGTLTVPLGNAGGIQNIDIVVCGTNGAGVSAAGRSLLKCISMIQVRSLQGPMSARGSGPNLWSLAALRSRIQTEDNETTVANAIRRVRVPLRFTLPGQEDKLGLDCTKYQNQELVITWDTSVNYPVAADGSVTGSITIEVQANVTRDRAAPYYVGCVRPSAMVIGKTIAGGPLRLKLGPVPGRVLIALACELAGYTDGGLITLISLEWLKTGVKLVDTDWMSLQQAGMLLDHSVIANYALALRMSGTQPGENLQPLPPEDIVAAITALQVDAVITELVEAIS